MYIVRQYLKCESVDAFVRVDGNLFYREQDSGINEQKVGQIAGWSNIVAC